MKKITLFFTVLFTVAISWHGMAQININETFDAGVPTGWAQVSMFSNSSTNDVCEGTKSLGDNMYGSDSNDGTLTSMNFTGVSNGTDVTVTYQWKAKPYASNAVDFTIDVEYSLDDGASWNLVSSYAVTTTTACTTYSQVIPAASVPNGSDFKFRMSGHWISGDSYHYIDDLHITQVITAIPNCDSTLIETTNIALDGAISWSEATGVATGYKLIVGTASGTSDVLASTDVMNVTTYNVGALTAAATYYVTITPYNGIGDATGCTEQTFTTIPFPPTNDDCSAAVTINCGDSLTGQTTVSATGGSSTSCQGSIGNDVWYTFVGDGSRVSVEINSTTAPEEAQVDVYASTDGTCGGFTAGTCDESLVQSSGGANPYTATFDTMSGTTYFVAVGNWINNNPGFNFDLSVSCIACVEVTNVSASNFAGTNADLTWDAPISGAPGYNWEIQPQGTAQGDGAMVESGNVMTNAATATALVDGTDYTLYVQTDCGGGSTSIYVSYDFTFNLPPVNDDCTAAVTINCGDSLTGQTTMHATGGSPTSCQGSIGNDVWYTLVGDGSRVSVEINSTTAPEEAQVDVYASTDGTCGGFTTGTCDGSLVQSSGGANPYTATFDTVSGTTYFIAVGNWINNNPDFNFDLSVTCVNCVEVANIAASNFAGTNADLTWDASAGAPGYNWEIQPQGTAQGDGAMVESGNVMTNAATATALVDGTAYTLYVQTDCGGGSTSIYASYDFTFNLPPVNDNCGGAVALTVNADFSCGTTTAGTILGATASGVDETACSGTENDDVWFSFVATTAEHKISLTNITGTPTDLYHSLWEGTCGGLTLVASSCSDGNTSTPSGLTVGNTYYVRVNSWSSNTGATTTFDVCIGTRPPAPANDDCANAIVINESTVNTCDNTVSGTTVEATNSADYSPTCSSSYEEVWYKFTAATTGYYAIQRTITNGTASTYLSVWTGTCGSLTQVNSGCSLAMLDEYLTAGTEYYISVASYSATVDFDLCVYPRTIHCVPGSSSSTLSSSTYIDTFTTTNGVANISNATTGFTAGYYADYFDTMNVSGYPTSTFDFNVEIVGGTVGCAIWVDWNNDLNFDQATETVYNTTGYGDGPFTGTVTIPSGTANGDYRMRVMIDYNDSNPNDNACLHSYRAEIEDYKIIVDNTLSTNNAIIAGFAYYPNPVNDKLSLQAKENIDNVEIMNVLGQTVYKVSPQVPTATIDMYSFNQGAYFVRIYVGNATKTIKILKN